MTDNARTELEDRTRAILTSRDVNNVRFADPGPIRPGTASFEIIHPSLAGHSAGERYDMLAAMTPDGSRAVRAGLAEMTRALRAKGVRATADYKLGTVVVSGGRPPETVFTGVGEAALLAWAASPVSDVDAITPALSRAAGAVTGRRLTGPQGRQRGGAPSARRVT